ncbi:hypothetical protein [Streptomyces klenkii]|uniref:hypothetical protein n=1 Tax=Streptomyces klenkii TaxID=1420899 RepID=UPI003436C050
MDEDTSPGEVESRRWISCFQQIVEPRLRDNLAAEESCGSLQGMTLDDRNDEAWVSARFSMATHPGVTFVWKQRVMPDLSVDWDPQFAAMLFCTHLIEWFHTEAKRRTPGADGTIRSS